MPDTSAVPSNSLTIVNPPPPPGETTPPSRFILFTHQWLDLQNYVSMALQMPITVNDFQKTYGDFPAGDKALIDNAVAALKDVQNAAVKFGDPVTLKRQIQSNPGYLNTPTPPTEIYAHIVWLANQIYNASTTFTYTFGFLSSILSPSAGTPEQRAQNLKDLLTGPGGLVSTADDMKLKTQALTSKLLSFDGEMTAANDVLQQYVGQGSQLIQVASRIIGSTQDNITNVLQPAADDAYKKWRDYTISAITTSIGILVLSGGLLWPIAVGLGVGLGVAAALQRKAYNALIDQIAAANEDIRKKTQLSTDLSGFNTKMALVAPAMSNFKTSLELVESVWVDIAQNLSFIVNNYGVDQLSSLPWVTQAMKIGDASNKWMAIGTTAQQFTQGALVSYNFSTRFGQKIPEETAA